MTDLTISNVINISVATPGQGVGAYNTSNLAIFTAELPAGTFGNDGFKIYLEPTEVATDFGSDSDTYKMALGIFSPQPNILAGGGYLVIIEMTNEIQTMTPDAVPASGTFVMNYDGNATAALNWDDTPAVIQTALRLLEGLEQCVVTGTMGTVITITMHGTEADAPLITISANSVQDSGAGAVTLAIAETAEGETIAEAITRTSSLVQYFGLMATEIESQVDMLAAAAVVQALNKIYFVVSKTAADADPAGKLDLLRSGGFTQTRGLLYIYNGLEIDALVMMASYAGRALSTNFNGARTTQTMHLKDLSGVQPDSGVTQTILTKCATAGVDVYVSIQGVSKVFCSGGNEFFDDIYNLQWLVGALSVAGFNVLATVSTKVPQTENGLSLLKSAYRKVLESGITNGYLAPGTWNSPTTFGNSADLLDNVTQRGYYLYTLPIAQQSTADREARNAPLVQIAAKYAGANHSSSVVVNINK